MHNIELEPCPFCGGRVKRYRGFMGLNFFRCTNTAECGAVMSFDNDFYNKHPEEAYKRYNRRSSDE